MSEYKLVPVEPTDEMVSAAEDAYMPFGDMDLALRMAILAAPAVRGELVEAAAAALDEIEKIMQEAYNSAYPVCCGRPGSECCGSPEPEWSEFDQNTMDRLAPHQRALTAALAAYRKGGQP